MTVRRGQAWGSEGPLVAGAPVVDSDSAAAALLNGHFAAAVAAGEPVEIGLTGGDLHRTLGSPQRGDDARSAADALREGAGMRFPVDVVEVVLDGGEPRYVIAHLIATGRRGVLWAGRTVVMMNASFVGEDNLGPRSHPGDGLIDITDGALPYRQRRLARRLAPSGSHIPHPLLEYRRRREHTVDLERPLLVRLDGETVGTASRIEVRCLPDAVTVVV